MAVPAQRTHGTELGIEDDDYDFYLARVVIGKSYVKAVGSGEARAPRRFAVFLAAVGAVSASQPPVFLSWRSDAPVSQKAELEA